MYERMDNLALREKIIKDCVETLIRYYALCCTNISFPEFINPTQVVLERYLRNTS